MPDEGARSALTEATFSGHRPARAGDLSVETHGIAPIGVDQRYGTPGRLFTVWFAPQVNVASMFSGTLAIVLGLGFWLGLLAMVTGTVLGSLIVGYLSTWGPRTGTGQLPASRWRSAGRWSSRPSSSGSPRSPGTAWSACSAARRWRPCRTPRSGWG